MQPHFDYRNRCHPWLCHRLVLDNYMMLIHPTHRKYIHLLRDRANSGNPVIVTKDDNEAFLELTHRTQQKMERHKGFYRITLRAINRDPVSIADDEFYGTLDNERIDAIERLLSQLERRNLPATLKSTFIKPILCKLIRLLNRKTNKDEIRTCPFP